MKESNSVTQFISIIPNLVGEGHTTPYHQAVSQGVQLLGWKHKVLIPRDNQDSSPSSDWVSCLYPHDLEAEANALEKLFNVYHAIRLGISLAKAIRSNKIDQSQEIILFLERFIHFQLLALLVATLLIPKKNLSIWLLYRRDIHKSKTVKLYHLLNKLLELLLPQCHFQLLTDSELLSESLSQSFVKPVHVFPIPHTSFSQKAETSLLLDNSILWCWWPGSPRLEKGWKVIQALSEVSFDQGDKIGLIASQNAQLTTNPQGIQLKLLANHLSRQAYDQWLLTCDIILLPYDSLAYQERTSGIFTEAIMAGKIPCVTPNTWMAYELAKYGLAKDLVLEWEHPEKTLNQLLQIKENPLVKGKLKRMRIAYQNFHTVQQYSHCLHQLFEQSFP